MANSPANPRHVFDIKTLEMLVCPLTKTRLTLSSDRQTLISSVLTSSTWRGSGWGDGAGVVIN